MLEVVAEQFNIGGKVKKTEINDTGHINKTFVATYLMEDGTEKKFLIQRINASVFKEPYKLMKNIVGVTNFIAKKLEQQGKDAKRGTLNIVKTKNGESMYVEITNEGQRNYWRAYEFIENTISFDRSESAEVFYNAAKSFGNFARLLSDYPIKNLEITIANFHNTPLRYMNFLRDIETDAVDRVKLVQAEIKFIKQRSEGIFWLENLMSVGEIPLRVTHNDTKLNNVIMDAKTGKGVAVVDLDTVMPGSLLADVGDAVRSGASTALEDEKDLTKVGFDLNLFWAFVRGYLSEMADELSEKELEHFVDSVKLLTIELAIRFLNDYINGDTYFGCDYENHNLVRARNQLKLVADLESKYDSMNKIVYDVYNEIMKKN